MSCSLGTAKGILHIGGNGKLNILELCNIIKLPTLGKGINQGSKHPYTGIAGSTATESHDNPFGPFPDGICNQLSSAIACGDHGVTLVFRKKGKPTGLRYLNDCLLVA